jgi:hypothetical protein
MIWYCCTNCFVSFFSLLKSVHQSMTGFLGGMFQTVSTPSMWNFNCNKCSIKHLWEYVATSIVTVFFFLLFRILNIGDFWTVCYPYISNFGNSVACWLTVLIPLGLNHKNKVVITHTLTSYLQLRFNKILFHKQTCNDYKMKSLYKMGTICGLLLLTNECIDRIRYELELYELLEFIFSFHQFKLITASVQDAKMTKCSKVLVTPISHSMPINKCIIATTFLIHWDLTCL